MVVDAQGTIYVGWKEANTPSGPGQRVAFSRSEDGGATWTVGALMDTITPENLASDPWLVTDASGKLYYARLDYAPNGTEGSLAVSTSTDGGRTWTSPSNPDDRRGFADKESMAYDGNGNLYVAYDDVLGNTSDQGDRVDLRVARSTDGGLGWSATVPVADTIGNILGPVLAARPDGTVYAAWWNLTAGNIMADVSHDRGRTWGADVRVNPVNGSAWSVNNSWAGSMPSIATDAQGRVYIAWADRGGGTLDVLVSRSVDGGATWSVPVRVNDATTRDQWMPSLVMDSQGVLHAAWMDGRTGAWNVYYANSTDGGLTWTANVRVTTAETPLSFSRPGDYLALAADANGTAYVAWTDGRTGSLNIYFARSMPPPITKPAPEFPWAWLMPAFLLAAASVSLVVWILLRKRRPPPAP